MLFQLHFKSDEEINWVQPQEKAIGATDEDVLFCGEACLAGGGNSASDLFTGEVRDFTYSFERFLVQDTHFPVGSITQD